MLAKTMSEGRTLIPSVCYSRVAERGRAQSSKGVVGCAVDTPQLKLFIGDALGEDGIDIELDGLGRKISVLAPLLVGQPDATRGGLAELVILARWDMRLPFDRITVPRD